jgi:large subunit ribosomal protein L25
MTEDIKIQVQRRTKTGTAECRRLRRSGRIPANVYGHKQDPLPVAFDVDAFRPVLLTGHKLVDLEIDGQSEKALIRDIQWDTFSQTIEHVDFVRVYATERMVVSVPVELRGTPQGVLNGGILDHHLHTLDVEAAVTNIPDRIEIKVSDLQLGQSVHVSDIAGLPEGVRIVTPAFQVVVQVVQPRTIVEPTSVEAEGTTQPELIGRKKEEDVEP